jgi:26S proteasome non-ATPase regulatory subunit 10
MISCSLRDASSDPSSLVSLLLSRGADANLTNNAGQTALHFTVSKNNLDVARLLIDTGNAKPSVRKKDRRQQLPLHRAAAIGSIPMMKLLVENRSPVNATDVDGMTALHHAVCEGHGDAAIWLLKNGAEWGKRDREDKMAIDLAPDAKVRHWG